MEEVHHKRVHFASHTEKVQYLIDHDYYENVYERYSLEQVEDIYTFAHGYPFEFASYMAISEFYTDYALKSNDQSGTLSIIPIVMAS